MIHFRTGWVSHQNQSGLAREIGQCCARLEMDLNAMSFKFRDDQNWTSKSKLTVRECNTFTTYGNLLIPYLVFCGSRDLSKRLVLRRYISLIGAPVIVGIHVFGRQIARYDTYADFQAGISNDADAPTALDWFTYCSWYFLVWLCTSLNLSIVIMFSSVAELDFKRRYGFIRFCTRLIELKKSAFKGYVRYPDHKVRCLHLCHELAS